MSDNYSGIAWYTFNLLQAIFELDKNNEYILFYNNSKPFKLPKFSSKNVTFSGFKYSNKILNLSFLLFNKPSIDKLIGEVDIFFMPNINFSALSNNCKKVITVHDLSYLRYPQFLTLKSRFWHKILMVKRIIEKSEVVIAVSESTKNDLIDLLKVDPYGVRVVYEGVDSKFRVVTNQIELNRVVKKYKLPAKFILYLGTLEPRKNIESIVEAYSKLNTDYYLVISGGGGWKSKKIMQLAKKNDKIKIIGYINESDKRGLYNLAGLFVYPSYYEGFGLPPIEAMACGTPVISGSNSSQVEIVKNGAILVDPYNVNELHESMTAILNNDELKKDLISNGFSVANEYSWDKTAYEVVNVFKTLNY